MYNHLEERCGECYFWDNGGFLSVDNGDCCRFPKKEPKNRNDGCGEFKPRKSMKYLAEEKK
jgi:hypothetical protein